jgi:hypothetical protein
MRGKVRRIRRLHFIKLMDGGAELLLDIADAVWRSVVIQLAIRDGDL